MDAGQLLVKTLIDLEKRVTAADEYEVLLSTGLLRKLLMDQTPLMDKVNSAHRLKIRFGVNSALTVSGLVSWTTGAELTSWLTVCRELVGRSC